MYLDDQNLFAFTDTVTAAIAGLEVFGNVIDLLNGNNDLLYPTNDVRTMRGKVLERHVFANTTGTAPGGTETGFELELVNASDVGLSSDATVIGTSTNLATLLGGPTAGAITGIHGVILSPYKGWERYLGLRVVTGYSADDLTSTGCIQCGLAMNFDGYKLPTAGSSVI